MVAAIRASLQAAKAWFGHDTRQKFIKPLSKGARRFSRMWVDRGAGDVLRDLLTKVSVSAFPEHTLSFRPKPSPRGAASWDTGEALGE